MSSAHDGIAMHVAIDLKNLALYQGGIAGFARPLIAAWLEHRPDLRFSLVAPRFDWTGLPSPRNWTHAEIRWPSLPSRKLSHAVYDLLLFPRTIARLEPRLVFSFYHDVLLPAPSSGIASAMMVYDTCLEDLPDVYPRGIRLYYLGLLRLNLRRARHILTISQASRQRILKCYGIAPERLSVIYNAVSPNFASGTEVETRASTIRDKYAPQKILFYTGGSEYRKNIGKLLEAVDRLRRGGRRIRLLTTGIRDPGWARALDGSYEEADFLTFLGSLSVQEVESHYAAADAVVYPSLCEGFGRVCLEAMAAGAPLACSDLPVLREVVSDYAHYFDPHDAGSIASGIEQALASDRRLPRRDPRFTFEEVEKSFLQAVDRVVAEVEAGR